MMGGEGVGVKMSATMVGRRRKIKKQWLKHPKAVPKFFFQNSGIPFLKILFRAYNVFIFVQTFQWTSSEIFFLISEFLAESLKTNKKKTTKKDHTLYKTVLLKKISLILRTLTHLTLKMIFFRNTVKNLWLHKCSCKHVYLHYTISWRPRTVFLKYFESKSLYISNLLKKKLFSRRSKGLSGGGMRGDWINFLRRSAV